MAETVSCPRYCCSGNNWEHTWKIQEMPRLFSTTQENSWIVLKWAKIQDLSLCFLLNKNFLVYYWVCFNTKMRQTEKILDYVLKNKVSLLVLVIKALLNNHVNKKKCWNEVAQMCIFYKQKNCQKSALIFGSVI